MDEASAARVILLCNQEFVEGRHSAVFDVFVKNILLLFILYTIIMARPKTDKRFVSCRMITYENFQNQRR